MPNSNHWKSAEELIEERYPVADEREEAIEEMIAHGTSFEDASRIAEAWEPDGLTVCFCPETPYNDAPLWFYGDYQITKDHHLFTYINPDEYDGGPVGLANSLSEALDQIDEINEAREAA